MRLRVCSLNAIRRVLARPYVTIEGHKMVSMYQCIWLNTNRKAGASTPVNSLKLESLLLNMWARCALKKKLEQGI